MKSAGARRARRIVLRLALSLIVAFLASELLLRLLLFADPESLPRWAAGLRRPELFAGPQDGAEYWKLRVLFDPASPADPHPLFHPLLGWCKLHVDPETYRHRFESALYGRRPVLMYGDSFTACLTGPETCWEGLLERSALNDRYALLNFGTGSYGLDQVYLLLRESLESYAALDPVVVIGILVDDDLDRSWTALREYPKPRLELKGGELALQLPERSSPSDYVQNHPPGIRSYLWRFTVFGSGLFPRAWRSTLVGRPSLRADKEALNRRILEEVRREIDRRGLECFVVLFLGDETLTASARSWQEDFLEKTLAELALPFVSSRRELAEHARRTGREPASYFLQQGKLIKHYPAETNEIVFGALLRGLHSDFDRF